MRVPFDHSLQPENWFLSYDTAGLSAAAWFDRDFADLAPQSARGAGVLGPLTGTGEVMVVDGTVDLIGDATFAAMTGTGRLGIGSAKVLGEVCITPRVDVVVVVVTCCP
jgi:hypothetical protein